MADARRIARFAAPGPARSLADAYCRGQGWADGHVPCVPTASVTTIANDRLPRLLTPSRGPPIRGSTSSFGSPITRAGNCTLSALTGVSALAGAPEPCSPAALLVASVSTTPCRTRGPSPGPRAPSMPCASHVPERCACSPALRGSGLRRRFHITFGEAHPENWCGVGFAAPPAMLHPARYGACRHLAIGARPAQ